MNEYKLTEHVGQKFNKLTVLSAFRRKGNWGSRIWYNCQCDCGKIKDIERTKILLNITKSCGCLLKEAVFPISNRKDNTLPFGEANGNWVLRNYTEGAKYKNLRFELSEEHARKLFKQNCFYCGKEPDSHRRRKNSNGVFIYNGIDRLDNNEHYIVENCVTCCKECNYTKVNKDFEIFIDWIFRVASNLLDNYTEFPEKYRNIILTKIDKYFPKEQ